MKTFIKIVFSTTMLLALVGCSIPERPVASVLPSAKPPITPYEREQTKENVRIVLLKVERSTVFTSQNVQNAEPGKPYPVPMIGITYLVEALGDEPFKHFNVYSYGGEISIDGKKVDDNAFRPQNLNGGGDGINSLPSVYGNRLGELPKSFDEKRSWIETVYVRTEPPHGAITQLKITTGFNDHPQTFIFDNVPMN
jgi:hypothetical protein